MTDQAKYIKEKLNVTIVDNEELTKLYRDKQGYAFDSLIYRFKEYQAKALRSDVEDFMMTKGVVDRTEAFKRVQDRHNRDLMRFIQILEEAIGEHD